VVCTAAGAGLPAELKESIDKFVTENKCVVFMKGTKQFPQCGFSNTVVQVGDLASQLCCTDAAVTTAAAHRL
jgi:glutaredoxin-related protein